MEQSCEGAPVCYPEGGTGRAPSFGVLRCPHIQSVSFSGRCGHVVDQCSVLIYHQLLSCGPVALWSCGPAVSAGWLGFLFQYPNDSLLHTYTNTHMHTGTDTHVHTHRHTRILCNWRESLVGCWGSWLLTAVGQDAWRGGGPAAPLPTRWLKECPSVCTGWEVLRGQSLPNNLQTLLANSPLCRKILMGSRHTEPFQGHGEAPSRSYARVCVKGVVRTRTHTYTQTHTCAYMNTHT